MDDIDKERAIKAQLAFEARVRRHLDSTLGPRGFSLTSQRGFMLGPEGRAHHQVIYEANPDFYARRYPALRRRFDGDVPCIDLCIDIGEGDAIRSVRLEVDDIWDLLMELGEPLPLVAEEGLDAQLSALANTLRFVLDTFEGRP